MTKKMKKDIDAYMKNLINSHNDAAEKGIITEAERKLIEIDESYKLMFTQLSILDFSWEAQVS